MEMLCNCLYFGATVYLGSTSPASDFNELNRLVCFLIKNSNPPSWPRLISLPEGSLSKRPVFPKRRRDSLWRLLSTSAVYSLFIVLTATLRTDSSWVSSPSITEPNSPGERNENTIKHSSFHATALNVSWLCRAQDCDVVASRTVTLYPGSKHIPVRRQLLEISGKQPLAPADKPWLCTMYQPWYKSVTLSGTHCSDTLVWWQTDVEMPEGPAPLALSESHPSFTFRPLNPRISQAGQAVPLLGFSVPPSVVSFRSRSPKLPLSVSSEMPFGTFFFILFRWHDVNVSQEVLGLYCHSASWRAAL